MDGDVAPLPELLALAERFDAWLVVDDAHGIGVLGQGRGTLAHFGLASERIVYMATLGKALGGYGAFVTGAPEVVEWLLQRARPYVFSTALPPSVAAAATAALSIVSSEPQRIERLLARIAALRDGLAASGLPCVSPTAIQPVLVGEPDRAVALSARLRERGHLVPAIRPPTVPSGTSRLRVSLSSEHSEEQVGDLVRDLALALAA
jgi:8-amino-7-oxononanoate synthase